MQAAVGGKKKFKLLIVRGGESASALQEGPVAQAKVSVKPNSSARFGSLCVVRVQEMLTTLCAFLCRMNARVRQAEIIENIRSAVKVSVRSSVAITSISSSFFFLLCPK